MSSFDEVWGRVQVATGWRRQRELASFLGITPASVSGAKAEGRFREAWIDRIAEAFQAERGWLLHGENLGQVEPSGGRAAASEPLPFGGASGGERLVVVVEAVEVAVNETGARLTPAKKALLVRILFERCGGEGGCALSPPFVRDLVLLAAQ